MTPAENKMPVSLGRTLSRLLLYGIGATVVTAAYWCALSEDQRPWLQSRQTRLQRQAEEAVSQRRWSESVRLHRQLVKQSPRDPQALFMLAYSLHAAGRLDEAIEAHRRAAQFGPYRSVARYNLACALALQGRRGESLAALRQALDDGFRSRRPIAEDPDFRSLRSDAEFIELVGAPPPGLTLGSSPAVP